MFEKLNRQGKYFKIPLLEIKTTRSEMKNTLHGITILDIAKEKIIKCEDSNSNYTY